MSGLSRNAREFLDAAVRREPLPTEVDLGRLREAVLEHVPSAAAASAAAETAGKGVSAASSALVTKGALVTYAVIGAMAGAAVLATGPSFLGRGANPPGARTVDVAPYAVDAPRAADVAPYAVDAPLLPEVAPRRGEPSAERPAPRAAHATRASSTLTPSLAAQRRAADLTSREGARRDEQDRENPRRVEPPTRADDGGVDPRALPGARPPASYTGPGPDDAIARGRAGDHDLARRIDFLRRMRAELNAGRPAVTLELARQSEALFLGSPLEPESRAARIIALCRVGRVEESRLEIERFRRAFPSSVLAARVEESCASNAPERR